jgi:hypothetical protein
VGLGKLVFTAALYDLLLAPFVVPLVLALARRFDRDPLTEDTAGGFGRSRSRLRGRRGVTTQRGMFGRAGKLVTMPKGARR